MNGRCGKWGFASLSGSSKTASGKENYSLRAIIVSAEFQKLLEKREERVGLIYCNGQERFKIEK